MLIRDRRRMSIFVGFTLCCLWFTYVGLKHHLKGGNRAAMYALRRIYGSQAPKHDCAQNASLLGIRAYNTVKRKKWIIAVTVAGNNPYYSASVNRIIGEYARILPAWTVRICYDDTTPTSILEEFKAAVPAGGNPIEFLHAKDVRSRLKSPEGPEPPNYMVWRFVGAFEDDVERTISRDSDSMPLRREAVAIEEWIDSNKGFHSMRDHPGHRQVVLGGMWGSMNGAIPRSVLQSMLVLPNVKGNDQKWLADEVWPLVRHSIMIHDAYHCKMEVLSGIGPDSGIRPFPNLRPSSMHHVGGFYDGVAEEFVGLDMDTKIDSDPWACCPVQPAPIVGNCVCCRDFKDDEEI